MTGKARNLAAFYSYLLLEQIAFFLGGSFSMTLIYSRAGLGGVIGCGLAMGVAGIVGGVALPFLFRVFKPKTMLLAAQAINGTALVILGSGFLGFKGLYLAGMLMGLAYSTTVVTYRVLFSGCVGEGEHGRSTAIMGNVLAAAAIVGPLVVGLLASVGHFSSAFWVSGGLLVASVLPLAFYREGEMSFNLADRPVMASLREYLPLYAFRRDSFRYFANSFAFEGMSGMLYPIIYIVAGGKESGIEQMGWVLSIGMLASMGIRHLIGSRFDSHGEESIRLMPTSLWLGSHLVSLALVSIPAAFAAVRGLDMALEPVLTTPMSAKHYQDIGRFGTLQFPALVQTFGVIGVLTPYALLGLLAVAAKPLGLADETLMMAVVAVSAICMASLSVFYNRTETQDAGPVAEPGTES